MSKFNDLIDRITIVGGTHGNEFIGPYILDKINSLNLYQKCPVPVDTYLANPEAFARGVRFIDKDLNRSFSSDILDAGDKDNDSEYQQARVINNTLGKEEGKKRFIIDLHSTTSNMGITLIVQNNHPLNLHAAAYVQQNIPEARILLSGKMRGRNHTLNSISNYGLAVEMGSIANGILRQDLFDLTEKVIDLLIKFLTLCATGDEPKLPDEISVFSAREPVPYPHNRQGQLTGMVHQTLQNRDYRLLQKGQPVFRTLDNKDILFSGEEGYPVFINEAAYYSENIAFIMTDRQNLPLREDEL